MSGHAEPARPDDATTVPLAAVPCLFVAVVLRWADGAEHPHVHRVHGPYPDEDDAVDAADVDADGWQRTEIHPLCLPSVPGGGPGLPLDGRLPRPGDVAAHPLTGWRWTYAPNPGVSERPWVMTGGPWTCLGLRYATDELAGLGVRLVVYGGRPAVG